MAFAVLILMDLVCALCETLKINHKFTKERIANKSEWHFCGLMFEGIY